MALLVSCIAPGYSAAAVQISWTDPSVNDLHLDTESPPGNLGSYKAVPTGSLSTTAPGGFVFTAAPNGPYTLNPGTTYYAGTWNGTTASATTSFSIPACETATPTITPTATATATLTASPVATAAITSTSTATPSITPTPSITLTPSITPTPSLALASIYSVENNGSAPAVITNTFTLPPDQFVYVFTDTVPVSGTVTYHVADMAQITRPFSGTVEIDSDQPIIAAIIGYDVEPPLTPTAGATP